MSIVVEVIVDSPSWHGIADLSEHLYAAWIIGACKHGMPELQQGEITLTLADDAYIQTLNRAFRKADKPTNVLSFPTYSTREEIMRATAYNAQLLGDIILAYETINAEALTQQKDFNAHVAHLTAHGALHLLGYDHKIDRKAKTMENLEIKILEEFGFKNPYICNSKRDADFHQHDGL